MGIHYAYTIFARPFAKDVSDPLQAVHENYRFTTAGAIRQESLACVGQRYFERIVRVKRRRCHFDFATTDGCNSCARKENATGLFSGCLLQPSFAVAVTGDKYRYNFHSLHYKAVTIHVSDVFGSRRVFLI